MATSLGRMVPLVLAIPLLAGPGLASARSGGGDDPKSADALEMSKAVACKKVIAYEDYVPLPDASLTSEDKLLVYYRPLHFQVDPVEKPRPGQNYRAKFSQDGRIRRKGEKSTLLKKDRMFEYDPAFETPSERLYLVSTFSLKGLPPGEYEFDIVLHDELRKDSTASQTLAFTIVPTPKIEGPAGPESPTGPAEKSKKGKASKPKP